MQSLDALALNARRLLNDAETVLSHGSHQTAASLAILVQGRDNKFRRRRVDGAAPAPGRGRWRAPLMYHLRRLAPGSRQQSLVFARRSNADAVPGR